MTVLDRTTRIAPLAETRVPTPSALATPTRDTSSPATGRALTLIVAALALGQATAVDDGNFHPAAIGWLVVAILMAIVAVLRPVRCDRRLAFIGLRCVAVFQIGQLALLGTSRGAAQPSAAWAWGSLAVALLSLLPIGRIGPIVRVLMLVGAFLAIGVASIRAMPSPGIDVYQFQQVSADRLLDRQSPYSAVYRDPYPADAGFYGPGVSVDGRLTYSFPYPPLSVLAVAPAKLMFGDIRLAHLAALALAGVAIAVALRGELGLLVAALVLFQPRSLLVVQAGWTEPLVILAAGLLLLAMTRLPRLTWIAVGLLLATKQYLVLGLPLLWISTNKRTVVRGAMLAAAITLPFVLWDAHAFIRSVVLWQLVQPFRPDALSLPALWFARTGQMLPSSLGFVMAGLATLLTAWKCPRTAGGLFAGLALTLLLFVAFNKQAFCNYYVLITALLAMAGGAMLREIDSGARDVVAGS